jgi:hypothetical protein
VRGRTDRNVENHSQVAIDLASASAVILGMERLQVH